MRTFQTMFNIASGNRTISFENGDSTTIPVVLELDVKPAENKGVDVATDPAVEAPEANPSTDEKATTEGQNLQVPEVEESQELPEVSLEDEVALAEAEAEKNELINEVEVVEDTVQKIEEDTAAIKETLDANDAAVAAGGDDQINAANVAIATQSLELRLERLGLNLRDLSASANISKETFVSKEKGGMGLKPSEVLRNLHNDICREDGVLDKIKAGGKAVWESIVKTLRKIYDFFFLNDKRLIARLEKLQEEFSDVPSDLQYTIDIGKIAPMYIWLMDKTSYKQLPSLMEGIVKLTKNSMEFNNQFVKAYNSGKPVGEILTTEFVEKLVNETALHIDGYDVSLILKDKMAGINRAEFNKTGVVKFETIIPPTLKDHTDYKISGTEGKTLVDSAIKLMKTKQTIKADLKKMIDNLEKVANGKVMPNVRPGDKFNTLSKSYYTKIAANIEKSYFDFGVVAEAVAREGIKAGKAASKGGAVVPTKQ